MLKSFFPSPMLNKSILEIKRPAQDFARPVGFSLCWSRCRSVGLRVGQAETRPRPVYGDRSMVRDVIRLDADPSNPCVLESFDRLMDMASQFRHVRFSGVDIGTYMTRCLRSATQPYWMLAPAGNSINMQFRSRRGVPIPTLISRFSMSRSHSVGLTV